MLSDPDVDAVMVSTPIGLHFAHGMQVLSAGKHLWCEKPLTMTGRQTRKLLVRARADRLAICEAFMYRYHPHMKGVRKLIRGRAVGTVFSLSSRFGIPHLESPGFRYSRELGGGAFLDIGCYTVSVAMACLEGMPRVLVSYYSQPAQSEVDLGGGALLQFPDGSIASLEWGLGRAYRNDLEIWGDSGSLRADFIFSKPSDMKPVVELRDRRGVETIVDVEAENAFVVMFEEFARTARDATAKEVQWSRAEAQAEVMQGILDARVLL
jgi:dTDP-3,4-didehydro-2,6-dideoxy-alpha-D-glucose 3-reductase